MVGDDLYKRGYGQPLLKCVMAEQAQYIIKELHEGICGYHSGARTMATRVQSQILLAHYRSRLPGSCQEMQAMPEARQPYSSETGTTTPYTVPMAIR